MRFVGPQAANDPELVDDGRSPSDRLALAGDFYRRFGWPDDRILIHLLGIDFARPVRECILLPGASVTRVPAAPHTAKEPTPALQFTARSVEGSPGGGLATFVPPPFLETRASS